MLMMAQVKRVKVSACVMAVLLTALAAPASGERVDCVQQPSKGNIDLPFRIVQTQGADSSSSYPRPTPQQLRWQQGEINALIHFNMATFVKDGDPACDASNWQQSHDPAHFNPVKLDTDNWVQSFKDLGVSGAVLTAKHGCGFLLWPTKTKFSDGSPYTYTVSGSPGAPNVLEQFSKSCEEAGIGHGFYYSLTNNFFMNVYRHEVQNTTILPGQKKVSQEEFERIALAQLTELWTEFGNLTEIWFDGGYSSDMKEQITSLLSSTQKDAVAFGGEGVSPSPLCWVGTESGHAPDPTWSTGSFYNATQSGDASAPDWCPKEVDTTLQEGDHWFWMPNTAIRMLAELIDVYHDSVGHNGVLQIDFAIDRDGVVDPLHAARYKEFGDWIRECYGTPAASADLESLEIDVSPQVGEVDRVIIQEDQSKGQRIRSYRVLGLPLSSDESDLSSWAVLSQGSSVGNKKIDLFDKPVKLQKLKLEIDRQIDTPVVKNFSVFTPCPQS